MNKTKHLKVDKFLGEMNKVVPWEELCSEIEYYYHGETVSGIRHYKCELMLRIYFLQQWYNMSDPGVEEAIYDRVSFQKFLSIDMFHLLIPDETSILNFRHLLEKYDLEKEIFRVVNEYLDDQGLVMKEGTVVDATLFQAPTSKKNEEKRRDSEMTSTKKNNRWYFGSKGHIGVQANGENIIHSVDYTTAKDADINSIDELFHGDEKVVFGDSAYTKRDNKVKARKDNVAYCISDRGSRNRKLSNSQKKKNRRHSSVRAKVEHPFRVIKHLWGHYKLRYKGLKKNATQFTTLCSLQNLYVCRKHLLATG